MLIVETIAKIRRAFFVQGKPIKAICRELNVSRKVVRKVIRSEATEFRYEREAQPLPKIGPWRDQLDQLLLANEGKASRERLTLIRLFEELRGQGYDGGYDAVRRYARQWSKERGATAAASSRRRLRALVKRGSGRGVHNAACGSLRCGTCRAGGVSQSASESGVHPDHLPRADRISARTAGGANDGSQRVATLPGLATSSRTLL